MKINTDHKSPNFSSLEIPVDFLVLHYTACNLARTLDIFKSIERKVSAHFVIDTDGTIYDLGDFLNGPILRGAHAGKSHLELDGTKYVHFNQFSIGIELINLNGNLLKYSEEQYDALQKLVGHLQKRFPNLKNPERIVGHEHIAHWRGKADPGVLFDWNKFFTSLGMSPAKTHSFFACAHDDLQWLKNQGEVENWSKLSFELESRIGQKASATTNRKDNYFILAGTSGTGKTTVLNQLRNDGFNCIDEAARSVLQAQLAIQGPGLPSNNPLLFIQMMRDLSIQGYDKSTLDTGPTFFDRGMPDLVHYASRFNVDPAEFEAASKNYLYNQNVFVFAPWKEIFVNDNERRMTFEQTLEFHEVLMKIYRNFGYNLIQVPFDTVEKRKQFILDCISQKEIL